VEIFNGVCRYLKVYGPGRHHPSRGRITCTTSCIATFPEFLMKGNVSSRTDTVCLFCFVSVQIWHKISQPKINFLFLKIEHSILHPLNFRVYSRNILLVAILAVNIVRFDKICYAKWAHGIGGMGQNLRKTPKTIRGFYVEAEGRSGELEGIRHARELSWSGFPFCVLN
jgi:hypothetical protein